MWGAQLEVIAPFQLFPRRKGNALLKENNHFRENVSHSSALLEATPSFCMSSSRAGESIRGGFVRLCYVKALSLHHGEGCVRAMRLLCVCESVRNAPVRA